MLNFTVGPVQSEETICRLGAEQVPYFRTIEFSEMMKENEAMVKRLAKAESEARAVFLTASSTGAMEATVMNVLGSEDKVLVINGGSFGERFVQLCRMHQVECTEIKVEFGKQIRETQLEPYIGKDYTGLLVNIDETSTGVYYDPLLLSKFCRQEGMLFIVDAVSSFLADDFRMQAWGADVMITGSQKALACPPGISLIVLSRRALERVERHEAGCVYFDLQDALRNGERGQTPFTPAVSILLQIHARLKDIEARGGAEAEVKRTADLAEHFRRGIANLPVEITSESLSNALTPLHPLRVSAYDVFLKLKDSYGIWVCPNGGQLSERIFRVGHLGALTWADNECLLRALRDVL